MNKAFTLIELLVVVLIIGILASIALPQYQTAVNKSRYAGLMPLAKAVKDAEEEMLMSKGDYTADLRDLSIQVPGTISQSGNSAAVGDGTTIEVYSEGTQDFVKVSRENLPNTYVMYFNKSGNFGGGIHCEAAKDGDTVNKRAQQLCESLGGKQLDGTGTSADYVTYVLEGPTTGTGSGAVTTEPGGGSNSQSQVMANVLSGMANWEDGMDGQDLCVSIFGDSCSDAEYTDENGISYSFSDDSGFAMLQIDHPSFQGALHMDNADGVVSWYIDSKEEDRDSWISFAMAVGFSEQEATARVDEMLN